MCPPHGRLSLRAQVALPGTGGSDGGPAAGPGGGGQKCPPLPGLILNLPVGRRWVNGALCGHCGGSPPRAVLGQYLVCSVTSATIGGAPAQRSFVPSLVFGARVRLPERWPGPGRPRKEEVPENKGVLY